MSDKIKKAIIDNIVKPEMRMTPFLLTARVKKTFYVDDEPDENSEGLEDSVINSDKNAVDLEIEHPFTGRIELLRRVPLIISPMMGGVQGRRVQIGDTVLVAFVNGSMNFPRVIGKLYSNFQDKNIEDSIVFGGDIPDYYDTIL